MEGKINHKAIVLAREVRGHSQKEFAELLEIDQAIISKIEQGLRPVTESLLTQISKILDFPENFFFEPVETYGLSMVYFRKRKSLPVRWFNELKANIELRRFHIEKLLASVDVEVKLEYTEPDETQTPEDIARACRYKWGIPEGPIKNVVDVLEDAGILVLKLPMTHEKLDGITFFTSNWHPIIYINYDKPPDRINFNLAHELGHLVMHLLYVPTADRDTEDEANRFASEFLMPESEIKPYLNELSLPELADLKRMWNVSMAAVLYKAHYLGCISDSKYTNLNIQLSAAGYKTREPDLGLVKHEPRLLTELIETHLGELAYTKNDLASLLKVNPTYLNNVYFGFHSGFKLVAGG